jgi:DNA repair exonuclease SbcCD ATPase subunit
MAEIQAAVDEHRAAMQRRDEEYAELRAKKDAELEELEKKHKAELDAFGESMSRKVDDLLAQVRAKVSANEELQQQLDDCRDRMSRGLTEKQESLRAALRDLDDARAELERMKTELDREVERRKTSERNGDELSKGLELEILELKRRLEVSDRDSATEIARLRAEIERLKAELEHERAKRRELESKLRLAEESLRRAKLVGIGMRITDGTPHQITEIIEGGAAHLSGALQVGDYLVEVAQMDVNVHSISEIRNFILGPAGVTGLTVLS